MTRTNEQIKTNIVNRLFRDIRVDASDVLVKVDDGIVTLMGTVSTYAAKRAAFELAREVRGVRFVDNQLKVVYPETFVMPIDSEIERNAQNILSWNPNIDTSNIKVSIDSGIITLKGTVTRYWEKYKAEDLVSELIGVLAVKNELTVVPTDKIDDKIIAKDIIDELNRSNLLDANKVEVKVAHGVVTLTGTVDSYPAEKCVYDTAVHTSGVVGVINKLNVVFE